MIKNAKQWPKIFYGLHMAPGVAEYKENGDSYRIFVDEPTIKNMDSTFTGKPLVVEHIDEVSPDNVEEIADGYVIESFYNKADGKHWAKFLVISDRAHQAIQQGWKLSNAYVPKSFSGGGLWHGVEYLKEVTAGEYEHLAIVPNPRYEESIILTPEQFKQYNQEKEQELLKVANSKESKGIKTMFNLFKKTKIENKELEETMVKLPKSEKEISIAEIINMMDEYESKKNEEKEKETEVHVDIDSHKGEPEKEEIMANGDHKVMVGEHKMSVNELVEKHMELMKNMEPKKEVEKEPESKEPSQKVEPVKEMKNDEDEEAKKKALELAAHEEKEIKEKKQNAFDTLKNAPFTNASSEAIYEDKIARGKAKYGSGN